LKQQKKKEKYAAAASDGSPFGLLADTFSGAGGGRGPPSKGLTHCFVQTVFAKTVRAGILIQNPNVTLPNMV
jgi:hypothetical protein